MTRAILASALLLTVLGAGCRRDPAPHAEAVAEAAPSPPPRGATPDAAPLPPPRLDPTLRFVKATGTADQAGDLVRPIPWIPDAPELEALLPPGPIVALEEAWERTDETGLPPTLLHAPTHLAHRVQITVAADDGGATAVALADAIDRLGRRLRPVDGPMPVLDFTDASLGREVRVVAGGPAAVAWGAAPGGRRLLAALDPKPDGRTLELVLIVIAPSDDDDLVAGIARAQPGWRRFAPLIARAGTITKLAYTRIVGRRPRLMLHTDRPVDAAEAAALRAIIEHGTVDTLERDSARMVRIAARHAAPWRAALTGALGRLGFRRTAEGAYRLAPDAHVLVDGDDCWLWVGSDR